MVRTRHFVEGTGSVPGWGLCSRKPCSPKNKTRKRNRIRTKVKHQTMLIGHQEEAAFVKRESRGLSWAALAPGRGLPGLGAGPALTQRASDAAASCPGAAAW